MTLDKSALQFLDQQSKKTTEVVKVGLQTFSPSEMHLVELPLARALQLNTLQGIVDYISSQGDTVNPLVLHVVSPTKVTLSSTVNVDKARDEWIVSEAIIPAFKFGEYQELESFLIKIRAGFQPDDQQREALGILGSITEKNVVEQKDEGLSQAVTTKKSFVSGQLETVPGRLTLAPYRTFVEVSQPASEFILRLKKVKNYEDQEELNAMLVEADGGAWRIAAKDNIKNFFQSHAALVDLIKDKRLMLIG